VAGGAIVDGAPGVFAAGVRTASRSPPETISHGRTAIVGGARLHQGTSGTFTPAMLDVGRKAEIVGGDS